MRRSTVFQPLFFRMYTPNVPFFLRGISAISSTIKSSDLTFIFTLFFHLQVYSHSSLFYRRGVPSVSICGAEHIFWFYNTCPDYIPHPRLYRNRRASGHIFCPQVCRTV